MSEPFISQITMFTYGFNPRGWAYCDGQLLPIATNTALFSLIGTTYGGDGRTTTALPNLQDRAPMHSGRGPGLTERLLGESVGANFVTLTQAQIPSHSHTACAVKKLANTNNPTGAYVGVDDNSPGMMLYGNPDSLVSMSPMAIGNAGGSQSHENRQPYLTVSFCIALVGLFPSRG